MKFGFEMNFANPEIVEIAGWLGYHFVWIDTEHASSNRLTELIRAADVAGLESWVRVPANDAHVIGVTLEAGANAIVVPHVNNIDDAELAVSNSKFKPNGKRNWFSKSRDSRYGLVTGKEYTRTRTENTRLIVQIEEPQAVKNIEEILAVEGIDMVATGPGDLAHLYDIPGELSNPLIVNAEETVFTAADQQGKGVLHFANTLEELQSLKPHPVEYLVIASDLVIMRNSLQKRLHTFANSVLSK